jgi:hypothetical protein
MKYFTNFKISIAYTYSIRGQAYTLMLLNPLILIRLFVAILFCQLTYFSRNLSHLTTL